MGVGYLGICFEGDTHREMLMERIIDTYLLAMRTEGNIAHHPAYAKFVASMAANTVSLLS
jgi:hypothetical protein